MPVHDYVSSFLSKKNLLYFVKKMVSLTFPFNHDIPLFTSILKYNMYSLYNRVVMRWNKILYGNK